MEAIEYLGSRKIVKIRINNGSRIKISIEPERAVSIEKRIGIRIKRERVLLFNSENT